MLGIDTNLLVRYIVQDDPIQSHLVSEFFRKECTEETPGYINNIVLCELVWVLESAYSYEREQVADVLKIILETNGFIVEEPASAWSALEVYHTTPGIDFSDALLGERNHLQGCETTVTLDKKASKTKNFRRLTADKK